MKGERQLGQPYLTGDNGNTRLRRITLDDGQISEGWIQRQLHDHPDLLPLDELDSTFRDSIALCRELRTPSGRIDNVYISPTGYLTLVEAKLYRNPQARREVVGQIIDYVKDLSKWTFSELDSAVRSANQSQGQTSAGILELLTAQGLTDDDNHAHLINAIDRGLQRGEMLLLIVGDGIHESVEDMTEYIQTAPQLRFGLGLLELQVYRLPATNDLLLLPRVVTRTREVVRAVVHVNLADTNTPVRVSAEVPEPETTNRSYRSSISEDSFFEQLQENTDKEQVQTAHDFLLGAQEHGYVVEWTQSGFAVKYADPNGGPVLVSLFIINRYGYLYLMSTDKQLKRIGLTDESGIEYVRRIVRIIPVAEAGVLNQTNLLKYLRLSSLKNHVNAFMEAVAAFIARIEETAP